MSARRSEILLILTLGALMALSPFTIDLYLAALPVMEDDLGVSGSQVQLTLTGTLVGIAVGQLLIGSLSDVYGRRRPLIAGTCLHVVASFAAVGAPTIATLGAARFFQGLGASAAAVTAVAIVRDLRTGQAAATLLSRLILVLAASPVLAPALGSGVLEITDWHGVFAALALLGAATLLVSVLWVPESLPPERRRRASAVAALRGYASLLRDWRFLALGGTAALALAGVFAYVAGSSFVFQDQFGLSGLEFSLLFASSALFLIAGTQLNIVLLRSLTPARLCSIGVCGILAAAALGIALHEHLAGVTGAFWLLQLSDGLVIANATALAISRHGELAGSAAAVVGAGQFMLAGIISPLVGALGNTSMAMTGVMAACALCACASFLVAMWGAREPAVAGDTVSG